MREQNPNPNITSSPSPSSFIDPNNGFCSETKIYHSLRPPVPLPPESLPLSAASYATSLLPTPLPSNPTLIDAPSGLSISYPDFLNRVQNLSSNLKALIPTLSKGQIAFVISPPSLHIPILYYSLLSLGVVISPSNPISTPSEIKRQIKLSKPSIFFATSSTVGSLPSDLPNPTIMLLDSNQFVDLMTRVSTGATRSLEPVRQSDPAAILYSSGTTGRVKGVLLTHRNMIAVLAGFHATKEEREKPWVALFTVPLFHVFGFLFVVRTVAGGETVVLMERFDFVGMLKAVERYGAMFMPVSPPLVVAMAKSEEVEKYDLRSLELVGCGGAPLGKEVAERFKARFPNVEIAQVSDSENSTIGEALVVLIHEFGGAQFLKSLFRMPLIKSPNSHFNNPSPSSSSSVDANSSGFSSETKIYHSLRPPVPVPPPSLPLSAASYATSLLPTPLPSNPTLIDAPSGLSISYPDFLHRVQNLSSNLKTLIPTLSKGQTAFVLSPSSLHVPILYYSLLSLGVVISPSNPISTPSEIKRQIKLSKPSIFFATSSTVRSLPSDLPSTPIILDSNRFDDLMTRVSSGPVRSLEPVSQSDPAAVLYSSGTTGRVKGVVLTHRNLIVVLAGLHAGRKEREKPVVAVLPLPMFHVFGFVAVVRQVMGGSTIVLMERFQFAGMLRAVERYRATSIPMSPPLLVAMAKSEEVEKYDLQSLEMVVCGGAPLGKEVAERFNSRFPNVEIVQGYGLTESTGGATRTIGPDESQHYGSAGRLAENMEAKIVDPDTGEALRPGQKGELWLRGPSIMQGYVGDDEATASTLDSEGWLKTGDLCYFDHDGFLFVVDRLKELIKYKAYQVPPAELEQLLQSHQEIADAAVIPYPDEEAGQIPMAYVVRKAGSTLTEAQVMDFTAKQVAPYKKIRRVAFANSIPKSAAGKILRRELINHALSSSKSRL
ncbi:AMP-dependent synthetase and ligase family protein [Cinnamomum micranthum f. kanehirae]|uniref:AMP-dependent synthetase and ligase family protein n=1 Tax=Cinnamomum micranthum f. kanehirae TaxID=337451 RepID=A0A3S3N3K3_9MAGN|nr:AMP-dependent synthetase and ligase family protein [Cinnamomum micranthum f. kanehirae]